MRPEAASLFASEERNRSFSLAAPTAAAQQQARLPTPCSSSSSNEGGGSLGKAQPLSQRLHHSSFQDVWMSAPARQIHTPEWRPMKTRQGTLGKGRWTATKSLRASLLSWALQLPEKGPAHCLGSPARDHGPQATCGAGWGWLQAASCKGPELLSFRCPPLAFRCPRGEGRRRPHNWASYAHTLDAHP